MMPVAEAVALGALVIVIGAAVFDAVRLEIPDGASLGVLALALVFGLLVPHFSWGSHLTAPLLTFVIGLLMFSRGWLGGGDVKLLTAIAAWTGLADLAVLVTAVSLAGGILALGLLLTRRMLAAEASSPDADSRAVAVPYAIAIAIGTLWWLWTTGGGPLAMHQGVNK